jgi:hypothetical protein
MKNILLISIVCFVLQLPMRKLTIIPKNLAGKAASELKMNPDL